MARRHAVSAPVVVTFLRVRFPLLVAHSAAHGTESVRDVILVRWDTGATVGWGECPTLSQAGYSEWTTDAVWRFATHELVDVVADGRATGPDAVDPHAVAGGVPELAGALADARLDARLRAEGRSLAAHLGARRATVPSTTVVGLDRDLAAVDAPGGRIKLKVTPATVDRVRALRAARPDAWIAVDANGSFWEAPGLLERLDDLDLAYIEQPLLPAELDDHAALRAELRTPIALDESLGSVDALRRAISAGALDVASVKPSRLGGVEAAAHALAVCDGLGVDAFVGGMLETGIGRSGALALAALDAATLPTDLGPSSRYVAHDVCPPIVEDDRGDVVVPTGPGIGREPDPARLAEITTDELRVELADRSPR